MAKPGKTVDRKKILRELKGDPEQERRNITFSLPKDLVERFKVDCQKNELTMNRVIQKLIEDYMGA